MPQTLLKLDDPVITIADTEAELTTGLAIECQMSAATLTSTPNLTDVPKTGCYPPTQIVGDPTYALEIAWIQDWTDAAGVSRMAHAFNGERHWVSFLLDADDPLTVTTAEVTVAEGQYGGTFGALAVATATWPIIGTPTFPTYTPAVALDAEADAEAEPATV
jgi:hypothetical protein